MGRKGNWFSAVKKVLKPEAKEKNTQKSAGKSKKKWFRKKKRSAYSIKTPAETALTTSTALPPPVIPSPPSEPAKHSAVQKDQTKHAYTVALPTAKPADAAVVAAQAPAEVVRPTATEAAVVAAQAPAEVVCLTETAKATEAAIVAAKAPAEVVRLTATTKATEAAVVAAQAPAEVVRLTPTAPPFAGKSNEEITAIKIQTAFRGYMGRRTLRALRGLMRLKTMMQGQAIKHQTTNILNSMQALARVQTQVRDRRQKMADENLASQKLVQQKYAKEQDKQLEKSQQNGDGWDSSGMTKKQIEAKMQSRHEAAIRRERTIAYAFTHQVT